MTRREFLRVVGVGVASTKGWSSARNQTLVDETRVMGGNQRTMDKLKHVYKGSPPDHCVCDQALRQFPNSDWGIIFMTGGDHEPRRENYIAMCRSKDRGATWSKAEKVLRYDDRACLLSEVIIHGQEIRIIAESHLGRFEDWRVMVLTSRDNGDTWDEPVPFTPMPRRAFMRNLYVSTWGEWFLPFQSYDTMPDATVSPLKDGSFKQALNGVLISDDEGRTWTKSADIGPTAGWAENNVVELRDGRLIMLVRADGSGHIKRSESTDRGRTWSPAGPTDIPNPGTKFRLHRLCTGRIALVHNPNPKCGVRNPLALWTSDDDMTTWSHKRVLTDFPGQLQYPDGFLDEEEGYVHFAFDYNRHDLIYVGAKLPE